MGDPRGFRTEDPSRKRRAMEPAALEHDSYQHSQQSRYLQNHNSHPSVLDRLGPKASEQNPRGKVDSAAGKGMVDAGKDSTSGVCF